MNVIELKERVDISENIKLSKIYVQFRELLKELRKRELPHKIIETINQNIAELNSMSPADKELKKMIERKRAKIIKLLEKELKIVPKNYYRNLWLAHGISTIGIPIGVSFGISMDNLALLGIGLPIGMAIGMGLGLRMDKKAFKEGRQLDLEV